MTDLFEYILIALVCPLVLPFIEPQESEDKAEREIHCNCTDAEIAKSFIEDVEVVKDLLPRVESEEQTE